MSHGRLTEAEHMERAVARKRLRIAQLESEIRALEEMAALLRRTDEIEVRRAEDRRSAHG